MDIVRFVEYIKEWELFEKIDFDQIVSDFDFETENFIKINDFWDFNKVNKNKKTLFILDKLLIENISNFFDMDNICILDLNSGFFSYGNKIWVSRYDIADLMNLGFDIYEPIDLFSMLSQLDKTGKAYIRVSDLDMPVDFVNSQEEEIVSMENVWFLWNMTIVSTWIMFTELVRLRNLLDEQWIHTKVTILNKLNFWDISAFQWDDNLVFVLDLFNHKWYEKFLKDKFKWKNLNFIYPSYNKLSTVLDEYKMEELEFDVINLVNKLLDK